MLPREESRLLKWHRSQGNCANSEGPVRMSLCRCSVWGQRPWRPRNCSWYSIKMWKPGDAELSCLFLKPQFLFLGLLHGRASSLCVSVLFTPQAFLSFGKNCCLAKKPWEALLRLLRNRKLLFAQSKQTHKLQGSHSVQMQSQEVLMWAEDTGTRAKNPFPAPSPLAT